MVVLVVPRFPSSPSPTSPASAFHGAPTLLRLGRVLPQRKLRQWTRSSLAQPAGRPPAAKERGERLRHEAGEGEEVERRGETQEQQQAYVGRVIEYVFRIAEAGKRKSKAQLVSYQGRITRAIGVRRRRAGQFIVLEAEWPTTFNEQTQVFDDTRAAA